MRSVLCHISSLFRSPVEVPEVADDRLGKLLCRQRAALAAERQGKLSVQATDARPEEMTEPLYDVSVYVSRPGDL